MSIANVLGSEAGLTLIAAVLGSIWTAFQSSAWRQQARGRRYARALAALEAGVERTYRTYVRAIKESRGDGKLTASEMEEARRRARESALEFGRTEGIDVVRELGPQFVDLLISKLVKALKKTN